MMGRDHSVHDTQLHGNTSSLPLTSGRRRQHPSAVPNPS